MVAEVKRSEPKLFANPFHKSYSGRVPRIISVMARAHGVIAKKEPRLSSLQEQLSFALFQNRKKKKKTCL